MDLESKSGQIRLWAAFLGAAALYGAAQGVLEKSDLSLFQPGTNLSPEYNDKNWVPFYMPPEYPDVMKGVDDGYFDFNDVNTLLSRAVIPYIEDENFCFKIVLQADQDLSSNAYRKTIILNETNAAKMNKQSLVAPKDPFSSENNGYLIMVPTQFMEALDGLKSTDIKDEETYILLLHDLIMNFWRAVQREGQNLDKFYDKSAIISRCSLVY